MLGSIIGDYVGSIYEFDNIKTKVKVLGNLDFVVFQFIIIRCGAAIYKTV